MAWEATGTDSDSDAAAERRAWSALACLGTSRRLVGGDVKPHAVAFAMARLLAEHVWLAS